MPLVYLAGPIDRAPKRFDLELIKELQAAWDGHLKAPLVVYSPRRAFEVSDGKLREREAMALVNINSAALHRADILLVRYMPGVETWGTPQEVAQADGIHVLFWMDEDSIHIGAPETFPGTVSAIDVLPPYALIHSTSPFVYVGEREVARAAADLLFNRENRARTEEVTSGC